MIRTAPRRMSAIRQSPATAIAGFQHCSRPARWKRWSLSGRLQIPRGGLSPKAMAPLRSFRIGTCRTRLLRKRPAAHLSRSRQRQPQCWRNGILRCNRCDRRSITRMPLAPSFRMVRISSRRSSPRSRHSTCPPGSRLGCAAPTGGQPAPETQLRRDAGRYRSKFPPALSLDATCALGGEQMKYVLQGRIATMDDAFTVLQAGAVYVDGRNIIAVQDVGAPPPSGFAAAITAGPSGIIFPGLIELHNHLSYNALTMWSVPRKFADRGQWQDNADYKHRVSDPMNTIAKIDGSASARIARALCGDQVSAGRGHEQPGHLAEERPPECLLWQRHAGGRGPGRTSVPPGFDPHPRYCRSRMDAVQEDSGSGFMPVASPQ